MSKIGSIYVEVRGDYSKYQEDIRALKLEAKKSGEEVSNALSNAISPKQATKGISDLSQSLLQLASSAKVPGENFRITADKIAAGLSNVAKQAGLSEKEFARLNERMLQTQAQKNAQRAFDDLAKSAGLSQVEMQKLGQQIGLSSTQMGNTTGIIDKLKEHWVAASAAIAGAWMLVNKAVAYMDMGAKAQQVESSFKVMADAAGVNSESMIASMKKATKETIEDSDLMQKAVKLMTLGYNPEQIERFSKVVITASQIAGTTAAIAYDDLADAIANRMPKALVRMGAVTREQMKIVTEAIAAGAGTTVLYELAMTNLELKQKMLQGTQDAATISLQRFHAQQKETTESIGKFLIDVMQKGYGVMQMFAAATLGAAGGLANLLQMTVSMAAWTAEKLGFTEKAAAMRVYAESVKRTAEDLAGAGRELSIKAAANISGLAEVGVKATVQEIANSKARVDAQMKELAAFEDTEAAKKKAAQEWETFSKMAIAETAKAEDKYWGEFRVKYEHGYLLAKGNKEKELLLNQWAASESGKILNKIELDELKTSAEILSQRKNDSQAEIELVLNKAQQMRLEKKTEIEIAAFTSSEMTRLAQEDFDKQVGLDVEYVKRTRELSQKELAANMELISARGIERKKGLDREVAEAEAASGKRMLALKFEYDEGKISLKTYLDSIVTATLDKDARIAKSVEENSKWIINVNKSMASDIAKFTKNEANLKIQAIEEEYKIRKDRLGESIVLERWREIELIKIDEERKLRTNDFWGGMKVAYQQNLREQKTWGQQGAEIWKSIFGPNGVLTGTLTGFFTDIFKGQLKSARDYFNSFKDAVIAAFAKMIAEMIAMWAAAKIGSLFGLNFGGFGGNIGGGATNALGNAIGNKLLGTGASAATSEAGGGGGILSSAYTWLTGGTAATGGTASVAMAGGGIVELGTGSAAAGATGVGLGMEVPVAIEAGMGATEAGGAGTAIAAGGIGATVGTIAGIAAPLAIIALGLMTHGTGLYVNPFASAPGLGQSDLGAMALSQAGINAPSLENQGAIDIVEKDPWFAPKNLYEYYVSQTGKTPTYEDTVKSGDPWKWFANQAHYQQTVNEILAWNEKNHPWNPYVDQTAAEGAIINEPYWAVSRSGKSLLMGEAGPEAIVPLDDVSYRPIFKNWDGKKNYHPAPIKTTESQEQPLVIENHVRVELEGRILKEYIYSESKRGAKIIHERGIAST